MENHRWWWLPLILLTIGLAQLDDHAPVAVQNATVIHCAAGSTLRPNMTCEHPDAVGGDVTIRINTNSHTVQIIPDRDIYSQNMIFDDCKTIDRNNWECNSQGSVNERKLIHGMKEGRLYLRYYDAQSGFRYSEGISGIQQWAFTHRIIDFRQALLLSGLPPWKARSAKDKMPTANQGETLIPSSLITLIVIALSFGVASGVFVLFLQGALALIFATAIMLIKRITRGARTPAT